MNSNDQNNYYINDPVINKLTAPENTLFRPKISYTRAALWVVGFVLFCFLVSYITAAVKLSIIQGSDNSDILTYAAKIYPAVLLVFLVTCSRFALIWFIRLYQRYAKSETRLACCFTPSCSNYTILALKKYGTIIGGIKSINRLFRCKPPGGIDYP
jgi:putative membrane protein insertion efficiency factor